MKFPPVDYDVDLTEEEFRLLRDFVHEKFGLYFDGTQRQSLKSRLAPRLALLGLLSFEDYYRYLRFAPERAAEQQRMVSHLTNNETYFFREQPQLQVFASHVLPTLKERGAKDQGRALRLVSVGCSTGEEALTLAMLLFDSGQFFWGWDVRVTGLDVDEAALEKAARGSYHQNSLRAVTPAQLERHFTAEGKGVKVKDSIRKLVTFRPGNLLDPSSYEGFTPADVIFCRNVLIYFSDEAIQRAVQLFHEVLNPGGFLFLGHAESLARVTSTFTPIRFQGAIVYQKPEKARA